MKEILKYFNKSLDEIMESLEYLAKEMEKEKENLTMEVVIQTTAGEVYTSEKILFRQDLQD